MPLKTPTLAPRIFRPRTTRTTRTGLIATALLVLTAAHAMAQEPLRDGWVVLGLEEYRALRARAFPTTPDPLPPPVDAALTRVDYDVRVSGDTVTGEARLTVDVLKQGWVSIQMPAGILVRGARLDNRPTTLVDGTPPRVLIARTGRAVLTLDIVVPIGSSSGIESMTLPPSTTALSAVTLIVPRTGLDLTVDGGFVADRTETSTENKWTVYGSPGRPLTFSWKRKVDDRRATLPLRTKARITEVVALGEEVSLITASVRLEIVQGVARDVAIAIPAGLSVTQVSGASVADWRQDQGTLTVTFLEPLSTSTSMVVNADTRAPRDGTIAIPIVRMPAAERETGGVAVDVMGAGEINGQQPRGFDPADPSDLGDIVEGRESPSMVAFAFKPLAGDADRALTVAVARFTDKAVLVANVEEARYDVLAAEDGKVLVRARYAVRNNQRAFLGIKLPPQSVLWSAVLAGKPIRPGLSSDGGYLMPLQKGRTGENAPTFAVELVYLQRTTAWTERGETRLDLPAVDLPVSRTGLSVHYSPRFNVEAKPGVFRLESDAGPWSAALRASLVTVAGMPQAPVPPPPTAEAKSADREALAGQALLDRFRREMGRTTAGVIPVNVTVPVIGPAFFGVAELTPESHTPAIEIRYKRLGQR
jgi:hypothetical protein